MGHNSRNRVYAGRDLSDWFLTHQRKSDHHRFSGGIRRRGAANLAWAAGSTGLCVILVVAGRVPRQVSSFQLFRGRTGRAVNPPPQFGQTLPSTFSTQGRQKVHSKLQIIASTESGGSGRLQFSQVGRSSRAMRDLAAIRAGRQVFPVAAALHRGTARNRNCGVCAPTRRARGRRARGRAPGRVSRRTPRTRCRRCARCRRGIGPARGRR